MEFFPTSGNLSSKYSPFYRLYTCVAEISPSACNMHPKCCGHGNLSRLRPVRVILQRKGNSMAEILVYIFGKGFPQATASLAACYNAVEWSYPPKSNNKIRKLDWHSIDVRRPSIGVQPSNNIRTSNGGQPWPGYRGNRYPHSGGLPPREFTWKPG